MIKLQAIKYRQYEKEAYTYRRGDNLVLRKDYLDVLGRYHPMGWFSFGDITPIITHYRRFLNSKVVVIDTTGVNTDGKPTGRSSKGEYVDFLLFEKVTKSYNLKTFDKVAREKERESALFVDEWTNF